MITLSPGTPTSSVSPLRSFIDSPGFKHRTAQFYKKEISDLQQRLDLAGSKNDDRILEFRAEIKLLNVSAEVRIPCFTLRRINSPPNARAPRSPTRRSASSRASCVTWSPRCARPDCQG